MVHIRHAISSDARAIAKIHVCSWQVIYRGHIPDNILDNLSVDEREKLWKTLLEQNTAILVLEENNNLVGFISYCPSRDQGVNPVNVAEISAIYLNPDSWKKGFGQMLCNAAINELIKLGYTEVTLWVLDQNQQAIKFYEKMCFINISEIKIDERDGYTLCEIKYQKILSSD